MLAAIDWLMLLLAIITGTGLLFSRDWRWSLGMLAVQYLSVFWMVQAHWPVSLAATKLVTGWMACAILGMAQANPKGGEAENTWLQGNFFQIFASGMVLAATFAVAIRVDTWLGLNLPIAWGSLLLIGLGLLHLGITSDPFQVIVGLLTVLAGFEISYASVESSALVTALLALVNLGLALAGAYFLNTTQEKPA